MSFAKNKYPSSNKIEYNYNYKPNTSIIINYFTSLNTLLNTINNLRKLGDDIEIIVNNDKALNSDKIMNTLNKRNDRLVVCNDLGERRGYHHGASISNASEYLIFTQDDDLAPLNNNWYLDCLKEFKNDDKLGMIGLLKGGINYGSKNIKRYDNYEKVYCSWLATGPLMIKKNLYFKVKGFSEEYSQIGEFDGGADADLATKVWLSGYKSLLLRTNNVKEWKRRYNRGNNKTPIEIKNIVNRKKRLALNNDIYYNKYKNINNNINEIINKNNNFIGIKL